VNEYTAGLNWFLTPDFKYQFNYDYNRVTDLGATHAAESINGFGVRMVLDF
jgi:phosphate-selective porin